MRTWNAFNDWNVRGARHTRAWVEGLIDYALDSGLVDTHTSILDYGCGTFDLGVGLGGVCESISGFDPHPPSAATARLRAATLPNATIYDRADDLPAGAFDLIIVNSVIQYFDSSAELETFLERCTRLLKPDGKRMVLIADVIPEAYSPYLDALDVLGTAARQGFLVEMAVHLMKSVLNGNRTRLARYAPHALAQSAAIRGFEPRLLARNLTPSRRRYTCLLTLSSRPASTDESDLAP